jgi:hypothetical protein
MPAMRRSAGRRVPRAPWRESVQLGSERQAAEARAMPHVHELVQRKAEELDQRLSDLMTVRDGLALLNAWRKAGKAGAVVCRHIEHASRPEKGSPAMEHLKMSLCPACTACPEVEIVGDEVRIGEAGNLSVLKKDEWNVLVDLIQSGRLTKV